MPINGALGVLAVGVGVDLSQFNSGMDQVDRRAASSAQKINSIGSSFGTGAAMGVGIVAATTALTALENTAIAGGKAVLDLSSKLEQARIGFTAFTGDAQKANDFIKQLQNLAQNTSFEFPSLLQASRQLMGMGIQAELVIPLLKDVATAVMAVGGTDVEIRRVNLAITQMLAAGKVNAQDMNQLAQAGIPAWKMLADSMGLSIGQVREMSKQGQISAAQMIKALDDAAHKGNMADLLAKSAETWQTATTNIIDGLRNIATEGFDPLFQVMRNFAVTLAKSLSADNTAQFAADMKATVQDLVNMAQPLGDAFTRAFEAFKTDGIKGAFSSILTDVQTLAQQMFGAGTNVVTEFVSGLLSGAGNLIDQAANSIAQIIADYLIGSSPPPVGPLSAIATGGANVISAYVEGMKGGLSGITDVAQGVQDALGNVGKSLTLSAATAELKAASDNLTALKGVATDVEGALRGIDDRLKESQSSLKDYQNAASDIKDAFEGAIDPLQRQVDALKEVNDLATKQADIQDRIQLAQLKGKLAAAQGDPVQRARLQNQLETLSQQEKELSLQESQMRLAQQSSDLAAKAKGKTPDNVGARQAENALAQRRLALQAQQNAIQQQLNGMVDKEAVARIKGEQAQVSAVKDQRDLNAEIADLNRQLQAAPLEAQIRALKEQERALIDPIQERIKAQEREVQILQAQRVQWAGLKQDVTDMLQATKQAQDEATKASKAAALANPTDLTTILKPEAITHAAELVGQSWLKGFGEYLQNNAMAIVGGALGAIIGGNLFGPLGALAGAKFGATFAQSMQEKFGTLDFLGGKVAGKLSDALNIDTSGAQNSLEAFAIIAETMRDRALAAIEAIRSGLAQKLQDMQGALSGIQTEWQKAFGSDTLGAQAGVNAIDGLNKMLQALQLLLSGDIPAALDTAKQGLSQFGAAGTDAGTAFTNAIAKVQTDLLPITDSIQHQWDTMITAMNSAEFKDNISITAGNISTALGLVKEIADKLVTTIEPLATAMRAASGDTITWGSSLQTAARQAAEFTTMIVNILDAENVYLATLGRIKEELVITGKGLLEFTRLLADTFIHPGNTEISQGHVDILTGLFGNMKTEGAAIEKDWADLIVRIKARAIELGHGSVDGITKSIEQGIPDVTSTGNDLGTAVITGTANALQSKSPSAAMMEQGTFATQGLADGITTGTPIVVASVDAMGVAMLASSQLGWAAIIDDANTEWALLLVVFDEGGATTVASMTATMDQILQVSTAGWSAIHASMTQQLQEIWALINQKSVDMVGAVQNMMTSMLAVVVGENEKWTAAGLALGTAFAQGLASAQLAVNRSTMALMGNVTGGSKASPELQGSINAAAGRHGLDPALFTAQLQHESAGFDPAVLTGARKGGAGELGIGQFLPSTLKGLGVDIDTYIKDVNLQIETSAKYLSDLVTQYGSIDKALQAYNGGPGGVGSPATQNYVNIIHGIAQQLTTQPNMTMMSSGGGIGSGFSPMNLGVSQITAGAAAGLSNAAAAAACGPYAASLFAQAVGRNPNLAEATELAAATGWTAARGMGGTGNFMALLGKMGINAVRQAATPENINAALSAGNPIALSTPNHYFVGSGGNAQSGINVGATGTVMGGTPTMTLAEITRLGGGMNDLIVLTGRLQQAGQQTFTSLTQVSGQFGAAVAADTGASTQLQDSSVTLAQSIEGGLVPAGLAAVGAVGQMSIGIQPLIAQFANGQLTTDQLGQAIVGLAASSGLTTAPLQAMQAGTLSTNAALRVVLASLTAADPAFGAIQAAFDATAQTSGDLAVVLQQGLANVTGNVSVSLQAMAGAAQPLQAAFSAGQISADQFVQGVVQLAATSGLTQAPLRMMQDGIIGANDALAMVVQSAGAADPAIASMGTSIGDSVQPATDAATAFLTWLESLQQTQAAVDESSTAVQQIPQAVTDIQQPIDDAANQALQVIPAAATTAVDSTIEAIRSKAGDAGSAAAEVGQAIVDALVTTVEAGASVVADAAMKIIQDALDAAKKAASEASSSVDTKTSGSGSSKKSTKSKTKSKTKAAAGGGQITPGVWTLVGEEGAELISPNGYVYTASETIDMIAEGAQAGIMSLEHFASGGSSKTKSSSKSKGSTTSSKSGSKGKSKTTTPADTTPKKQTTEPYAEELDLSQKILEITQQRDKLLVTMLPLQEAIRKEEAAMQQAGKGSLEDQLKVIANKRASLEIESKIYHLTYDSDSLHTSTHDIELKIRDVKQQQEDASKGDLTTQLTLNGLETRKLQLAAQTAQIEATALPIRQQAARIEKQMQDAQKGTVAEQIHVNHLQIEKDQNLIAENALQQQSAGLRKAVADQERIIADLQKGSVADQQKLADIAMKRAQLSVQQADEQAAIVPIQNQIAVLQRQIDESLKGNAADRKAIADNAARTLSIDGQSLKVQQTLLPVQEAIRIVQDKIDTISKGSLADQQAAVDLSTEQAKIQLQEIDINAQLRNVNAGTLSLTQEQINALHKQLEVLDNQKANLDDQTQTKALQAQVTNTEAQKQLLALQAQEKVQTDITAGLDYQKSVLQNQTDIIGNANAIATQGQQDQLVALQDQLGVHQANADQLSAQSGVLDAQAGIITASSAVQIATAQQHLTDLQNQLSVYDTQITDLEAQNGVLDLQMTHVQLQGQLRSEQLGTELIGLNAQLAVYDSMLGKINEENASVAAQSALIQANNAVAAAGYNAQLIIMGNVLAARQNEIQKLKDQKDLIDAQSTQIGIQNQIAATGHEAQLAQLNAQLVAMSTLSDDLNAQIGSLNAQKKIYQDIRDLADAIANRPKTPTPAPTPGGTGGGPPGTVAATATKDGSPTLYLSRGAGVDGWYTNSGQLIVAGGSANAPSGYKVKWLAAGGLLRAGEMAIVGENGPEPIIAARDMVVFPSERTRRASGAVYGSGSDNSSASNVTVNVEYHRHSGTDYGEGTLPQVVREAVQFALRQ